MEENKKMCCIDDNFKKSIKLQINDIDNLIEFLRKHYKEISCTVSLGKKEQYELQNIDFLKDEIIRYSKDIKSINILAKEDYEQLKTEFHTDRFAKQIILIKGETTLLKKREETYKYFDDLVYNNKLVYSSVNGYGYKILFNIAITSVIFYVNEIYFQFELFVYAIVTAIFLSFISQIINPIIKHMDILPRIQFLIDEFEIEEKKRQNIKITIVSWVFMVLQYTFLFMIIREL